jgi:hypothetical protein
MLRSGPDPSALLGENEPDDKFMWVRLIATVVAVSLGSSLQFGFATGSLNNLEQARTLLLLRFLLATGRFIS